MRASTEDDPGCRHCWPARSQLVASSPAAVARIADRGAVTNPGYCLVTSERHVPDLPGLEWLELIDLASIAVAVTDALRAELGATKVTLRLNWGPPGQHTPHLHAHLVPRFPGDGHHGYLPGPLTQVDPDVAMDLARRLRRRLEGPGPTAGPTPRPIDLPTVRHPVVTSEAGHPSVSVSGPPRSSNGSERALWLASALRAITVPGLEVIGRSGVTGITIRSADGDAAVRPTDGALHAYPRWPGDGFADPAPDTGTGPLGA